MMNTEIYSQTEKHDPAREAFLTQPVGRLMLKNALPAVASMLFMAFYQMADAILVGRRLGPEALASVNVLYPVLALFVGLAVLVGVGGNSRIAVLLGQGKVRQARHLFGFVTAGGAVLGLTGSALVILGLPHILAVLGTSGMLGELAGQYLRALYPFFGPMVLLFILEQAVRNDGQPNLATAVMAGTAVLNIVLDYLFLFPLAMGMAGAALATGISQSLGALLFSSYFVRKTLGNRSGLAFSFPKGSIADLKAIAANGSSELFNSLALGLTTFLFNRVILGYVGSIGVTAFALVQYMLIIGVVMLMGMGNGTQPIFSYNYGAGLYGRVRETLGRLLAVNLLIGAVLFAVLRWQAAAMASLFIPNHAEALLLTLRVANLMSWSLLFMPVGITVSFFFTALEEARSSFTVAVCRSLLFVVIGLLILPALWGDTGVWLTPALTEGASALVAIALVVRWNSNCHRQQKPAVSFALRMLRQH